MQRLHGYNARAYAEVLQFPQRLCDKAPFGVVRGGGIKRSERQDTP
jgi:hypothetical protein